MLDEHRKIAQGRVDELIRELSALVPCDEDFDEDGNPFVGQLLLNGWVLVLDWIDEENDSCIGVFGGPGMSRAARVGLLSLGHDQA